MGSVFSLQLFRGCFLGVLGFALRLLQLGQGCVVLGLFSFCGSFFTLISRSSSSNFFLTIVLAFDIIIPLKAFNLNSNLNSQRQFYHLILSLSFCLRDDTNGTTKPTKGTTKNFQV